MDLKTIRDIKLARKRGEKPLSLNGQNAAPLDADHLGLIDMDLIDLAEQVRKAEDKYSDEELKNLALCILTEGLFNPIVVIPNNSGRYDLEQGEHRFRAFDLLRKNAQINGTPVLNNHRFNRIPARRSKGDRKLIRQLKENLFSKSMTPLSEAKAVHKAMQENNWTQQETACELNKNQTWVSRRLALLAEELPSNVNAQSKVPYGKSSEKKENPRKPKVSIDKQALEDVCRLISLLSEKHGLDSIEVERLTSQSIKNTIEQKVAEVLRAERG